jgi:hypothetical protein
MVVKEERLGIGLAALIPLLGLILVLVVALAVAGLLLAQRRLPLELRKSHNDAISVIYGTLQVMFGVLIGFTAFLVVQKYITAQNAATSGAGDMVEIYRLADAFPQTQRDRIQELAKSYAQDVVDEEWPLMRNGQSSPRAEELFDELGRSIQDVEPTTDSEREVYAQELSRLHDLNQNRDLRLLAVYTGLPLVLWIVLGVLAVLIILFTYFLGMENAMLHRWAVGALTVGIAFVICAIVLLDHPFGGGYRIGPDAYERALSKMEGTSELGP